MFSEPWIEGVAVTRFDNPGGREVMLGSLWGSLGQHTPIPLSGVSLESPGLSPKGCQLRLVRGAMDSLAVGRIS